MSMVHGKKMRLRDEQGIPRSHPGVGILFLVLVGLFATQIFKNYDSTTGNLKFFGTTIQLGELDNKKHSDSREHHDDD